MPSYVYSIHCLFQANNTYIQHAKMLNKDLTPGIQDILSLVDIVNEDDEDDNEDDNTNNKKTVELVIKNPKLSHEEKLHLHEVLYSHHTIYPFHANHIL